MIFIAYLLRKSPRLAAVPIEMIPPQCSENATATEQFIFSEIAKLNRIENVYCFHSLGVEKHSSKENAECDFVILTSIGVFCLEVKGGNVSRVNGVWQIGPPDAKYTSEEGPFRQANGNRWAILKYLQSKGCLSRETAIFGWGVVFPSILFEESDPEWSPELVYDVRDRKFPFERYLTRLETYFQRKRREQGRPNVPRLSSALLERTAQHLRPDFQFYQTFAAEICRSQSEILNWSHEQYRILDYVLNDTNPRLICQGGPGTGKTILAIEAGRRLASQGKSVLIVCYNKKLANHIQSASIGMNFRVETFVAYVSKILSRTGRRIDNLHAKLFHDRGSVEFLSAFSKACDELEVIDELVQFDTIIVDEAQDILTQANFSALIRLLRGRANGSWLMFLDHELQHNVYDRLEMDVVAAAQHQGAATVTLNENFRNPKQTSMEAYRFAGCKPPKCSRKFDASVSYVEFDEVSDQKSSIIRLLNKLIQQGVNPADIAILSLKNNEKSTINELTEDLDRLLVETFGTSTKSFIISSISSFKGLEAEIVIIIDTPDTLETAWSESIMAVGITRARTKCFILSSKSFAQWRASYLRAEA